MPFGKRVSLQPGLVAKGHPDLRVLARGVTKVNASEGKYGWNSAVPLPEQRGGDAGGAGYGGSCCLYRRAMRLPASFGSLLSGGCSPPPHFL